MDSKLLTIDGVGPLTMSVFEEAGYTRVKDVYQVDGQEEAVVLAAHRLHEAGRLTHNWQMLAARCVTIIQRVRQADAQPEFPEHYMCRLSYNHIMVDPVLSPYGDSYERVAIEAALREKEEDPFGRPLTVKELYPNHALRAAIAHHRAHFMRFSIPFRVIPLRE
jgi:hypothetical protein